MNQELDFKIGEILEWEEDGKYKFKYEIIQVLKDRVIFYSSGNSKLSYMPRDVLENYIYKSKIRWIKLPKPSGKVDYINKKLELIIRKMPK